MRPIAADSSADVEIVATAFTPPTDKQLAVLVSCAPALAQRLRTIGYTSTGFSEILGYDGLAGLDRGEPEVVDTQLRAYQKTAQDSLSANSQGPDYSLLADAIRLFVLGDPTDISGLLDAPLAAELEAAGVIIRTDEGFIPGIDIRPILVDDIERLVFSDRDASMTNYVPDENHVLGVGRASRSLLDISPTTAVDRVLDLGAGCGIQALGQHRAKEIVATDLHPRANLYAAATFAANGIEQASIRAGSWFEPVVGEEFDRIVANPPFVVGLPEVGHVYRDSGLNLDGATELMVRTVADHLRADGTAHLLGAWVHEQGESWQQRIASWVSAEGLEVWVTQRDVASPAEYVSTWLRDESIDPRSTSGRARTRRWLDHFQSEGVEGIGFGYITISKIDGPSAVVCEEMPQPLAGPFRDEAAEYLLRSAWLRDKDLAAILATSYQLRPGVVLERLSQTDLETGQGFAPLLIRISRTDGPRWAHEVDETVVNIVNALQPEAPLTTVLDVMDMFGGFEGSDINDIKQAVIPLIVDLVRHGFLIPTELM